MAADVIATRDVVIPIGQTCEKRTIVCEPSVEAFDWCQPLEVSVVSAAVAVDWAYLQALYSKDEAGCLARVKYLMRSDWCHVKSCLRLVVFLFVDWSVYLFERQS